MEFDKDASTGEKQYQHYGQEFMIVLKGKVEISLGEAQTILSEGDSIYFNSHVPHSFKNIYQGYRPSLNKVNYLIIMYK